MKKWVVALVAALGTCAWAEDLVQAKYSVSTQTDVIYGQGMVGASSAKPSSRDLRLDVYRPVDAKDNALVGRPAVLLAFGGAFLRGSKGTVRFEEDGASDSAMGDYCQVFASAGYVCLSMEYRLMTEDPVLPAGLNTEVLSPKAMLKHPILTARIDVVRGRMGLPLLDDASREQLWNTVFAASEDMGKAIAFARSHAGQLGIDPERMAIGGFSSGGLTAMNVAYGLGVPVKAVMSLSGGIGGFEIRKTVKPGMPAGLFVMGQNDLEGVQMGTRGLLAILKAAGVQHESVWMPGYGHFYPMGAPSLGSDMSKMTLRTRALRFLEQALGS